MRISARTNAVLWAALALVSLGGVALTLLSPGLLGPFPIIGSLLGGLVLGSLAYRQWFTNQVIVDFIKVIPWVAVGAAVVILLTLLSRTIR